MTRPSDRWYASGLSFSCLPDCGACCTEHGDYAYVYLEDGDAELLAAFLGMSLPEFEASFTSMDGPHPILRSDSPSCMFLDGTRCSVYDARPKQCRTFPFWRELLRSRSSWESLRSFCPGIDQGERHTLPVILQRLAEQDS